MEVFFVFMMEKDMTEKVLLENILDFFRNDKNIDELKSLIHTVVSDEKDNFSESDFRSIFVNTQRVFGLDEVSNPDYMTKYNYKLVLYKENPKHIITDDEYEEMNFKGWEKIKEFDVL